MRRYFRKVALFALRDKQRRVLLQHRDKNAKRLPDYWAFFGGGIENGETPEQAVRREAREELGIELENLTLFNVYEFTEQEGKYKKYVFTTTPHYSLNILRKQQTEGKNLGLFSYEELRDKKISQNDLVVLKDLFFPHQPKPVSLLFKSKKVGGFCYRPEDKGIFPAVILVHGFGGGTHESKNKFMCKKLAKAGFAAFMFDFYNKPNGLSEFPVEEMGVSLQLKILRKIVDFVSAQSFVDKSRIGLTGHSLGGMTVVLYTPTDARIKALVVQSGVFEFGKSKSLAFEYHPQWKKDGYKIFDKSWGNMKVNYELIEDGLKHDVSAAIRKIKCPILIFHGDKDESVKVKQAHSIQQYLKPTDKLVIIHGADHCYKTNNTLPQATELLIDFMKEKIK